MYSQLPYTEKDFSTSPMMFYYEVTSACDLVCKHCRASAQETAAADELTHQQSRELIAQVATFPRKPHLVFTGGDPLKRRDLFELIRYATSLGISSALTPSATPLATREALHTAREAGIVALGISMDAPNAEVHDAFRGVDGSFARTQEMLCWANELKLPVQINTSITQRNVDLIDELAETLIAQQQSGAWGIAMWSLFFLVPVGRGIEEQRIAPRDYERVFAQLWQLAQHAPFAIKTTEAPHYRRYVLEAGGNPLASAAKVSRDVANENKTSPEKSEGVKGRGVFMQHRAPLGVTDGRGVMFVSNSGAIFPAGFLPLECGRAPRDNVVTIYQTHPTFNALQNPDGYHGFCGKCDYRSVCGGSRARAYALTGDHLASEPDCIWVAENS